jgi:tetratricopeptide (TPR) repeat protein
MAELKKACKLLTTSPLRVDRESIEQAEQRRPPTPASPKLDYPWSIPRELLYSPSVRHAVLEALHSGEIASSNPSNYEAIVRHGLNLQELASQVGKTSVANQEYLLRAACEAYRLANALTKGNVALVLFNWAVALSDLSGLLRQSNEEETMQHLKAAGARYEEALAINPTNAQALNNWALVLQEQASLSPTQQKRPLLASAIARFRAASRFPSDIALLSRFCYNLGTSMYAYASSLAEEFQQSLKSPMPPAEYKKVLASYSHSARCIIIANVLQPDVKVYKESLAVVQKLLPLPYLQVGALSIIEPSTENSPQERWIVAWFVLDSYALQSVRPPASEAHLVEGMVPNVSIDITDIVAVETCQDPSLPPGWAIWIGLKSRPYGMFLVAGELEEAKTWSDSLTLLSRVAKEKRSASLQDVLLATRARQVPVPSASTPA